MKYFILFSMLISGLSHAASSDVGTVSNLYVDTAGVMAVKLKDGFPNSSSECSASNGWAYLPTNAPSELKSVLIAAKATQSPVSISIYGCVNGTSLQIGAIYLN